MFRTLTGNIEDLLIRSPTVPICLSAPPKMFKECACVDTSKSSEHILSFLTSFHSASQGPVKQTRLCSVCKRINSRPSPDKVSGQLHIQEPGTDSQPLLFHQRFFLPVPLAQLAWDGNRWGAWVAPRTAQICGRAAAGRKGESFLLLLRQICPPPHP